jgi:hypothetical protein
VRLNSGFRAGLEPVVDGGDLDGGFVAHGELVVSGRDATMALEPVDPALELPAAEKPVHALPRPVPWRHVPAAAPRPWYATGSRRSNAASRAPAGDPASCPAAAAARAPPTARRSGHGGRKPVSSPREVSVQVNVFLVDDSPIGDLIHTGAATRRSDQIVTSVSPRQTRFSNAP